MVKLETYIGFEPAKIRSYFEERHNWPVIYLPVNQVKLDRVDPGAALECGDGRFDYLPDREMRGPRVLGGINVVMAMRTGWGEVGFKRAKFLISLLGATPGTHSDEYSGCGYVELSKAGRLESARYPFEPIVETLAGEKVGPRLRAKMKDNNGKHFRLNGNHIEEGVRLNPFRGMTEAATDGSRFRIDDWFLADLGIPDEERFLKIAEVVRQLKPDAQNLEIIVP